MLPYKYCMRIVNPTAKKGEDLATVYLKKKNFKIIERNFHARGGEIDIIAIDTAEKEPVLAFIEVKTRSSDRFGTPLEAITSWKLRSVIHTAQYFVQKYPKLPQSLRVDAVSVYLDADGELVSISLEKNISGF